MRAQIESFSDLQPSPDSPRNTPIAGVLLTNADLDHTLGLFLLREGRALNVYAPPAVRATVDRYLGASNIFHAFSGINWHEPPVTDFATLDDAGNGDLKYRAIPLPGSPPPFAKGLPGIHSVAYQFHDVRTGGRLLVAPDVCAVTAELREALAESDAVLFDGTFWSREELAGVKSEAPPAEEMGHVTIRDVSLNLLSALPARRKIYLHINNTNPILSPQSPERTAVERAGVTIGHDGLEFDL